MNAETIFSAALKKPDPDDRERYLIEACGGDLEQRKRVRQLLASHDQSNSLLDRDLTGGLNAAALVGSTIDAANPLHGKVSEQIGSYRLLHLLGEGGMGSVYMAEQARPVRRRVAVKIIKQGLNSSQFTARFEAERQAIAMMDHPNIAKVLDAGCTQDEAPFFVMELVKGVPITDFCDQNKLSTTDRLELFIQVCNAVQHAHQKGIIHRDLKPSNVMVALYDDKPVPKVIDFGVAKATHQPLTEQTLYTVPGQIVGTWEYMSPEQAILNQLDVDTRTDIYSLGVILYELLTGHTPLDLKSLQPGALEERLRRIREEEPSRPSLRVSSLGAEAGSLATYRGTEAKSLTQSLRGDLDWIVMKAIEKDRSKRYETANGFAAEICRFLNDEPISFRPPSSWAQFGRFYRRNRAVANSVGLLILALSFGLISTLTILRRAIIAEQEQETTLANLKLSQAETQILNSHLTSTLQRLQREFIDRAIGAAYSGDFDKAMLAINEAKEADAPDDVTTAIEGLALYFSGNPTDAIEMLKQSIADNEGNIPAWSALFLASDAAAEYNLMSDSRAKLQSLKPRTQFETIFKAQTDLFADPESVTETLAPLVEDRPFSGILRALYGSALIEHCRNVKNAHLLRKGLEQFAYAETYLPNNLYVESRYLYALVTAIKFQSVETSDPVSELEVEQWKSTAEKLVTSLEANPLTERGSRIHRATYFKAIGREAAYHAIDKSPMGPLSHLQLQSAELASQGKFPELLDFVGNRQNATAATIRGIARILSNETGESPAKIAAEHYASVTEASNRLQSIHVIAIDLFLIAGDLPSAIAAAESIASQSGTLEWDQYQRVVDYLRNPSEKAEKLLLSAAAPFTNATSYAENVVGMVALARGEPEKAKLHFANAVAQGKFYWWSHCWSKAYLKLLTEDPTWPHWINTNGCRVKVINRYQ